MVSFWLFIACWSGAKLTLRSSPFNSLLIAWCVVLLGGGGDPLCACALFLILFVWTSRFCCVCEVPLFLLLDLISP